MPQPFPGVSTQLTNDSIQSINSLGGPAIPMGMDRNSIKVTLDNFAAQDVAVYQLRVADMIVRRL